MVSFSNFNSDAPCDRQAVHEITVTRRHSPFSRKIFPEMTKIIQITPGFAVAGQLDQDDISRLAGSGFRTIING